jgi:hypothetical protein
MRRDSRPGQASCCRLVTKRTKFNLYFAFMPPFQIGEKQLGHEVVLPSGEVEFAAQRHPRAIPLYQAGACLDSAMVAVHARRLLASLPSRIFERQAGIGVPVGCTTELKVSWLGTPFLDRRNLSRKSRSALGQTSPHLLLSGCPRTGARRRRENGRL